MVRPVFVAPHYDDVALSCGGLVAIAARTTHPLIITVFGGIPSEELGEFARFQHERWGVAANDVIATRRREDACAARALGANVETLWLDYLDAIYRNSAYDSDDALFGQILPDDAGLVGELAESIARHSSDEVYVPLALGNHVDHQLLRLAGERLAAGGLRVWGYLDAPYVIALDQVDIAAAAMGLEPRMTALDADAFARRTDAVECYVSQLPVLFRELGNPRDALSRYLTRSGDGHPSEVVYRIAG